ncbi:MAG TPA: hypothetical protein PK919_00830 [Candidatus Aminicenantes bacterium]|nr:hypothetical protein [Candidatus Aminicenantes bacterium]
MPLKQHLIKRNVLFVLVAIVIFLMKAHYHGPLSGVFHDYGGNFTASFAVYFVVAIALIGRMYWRLITAITALLVVESFELTDGFGIMSNVFDPLDLLANAAGIGLALAVDWLIKPKA